MEILEKKWKFEENLMSCSKRSRCMSRGTCDIHCTVILALVLRYRLSIEYTGSKNDRGKRKSIRWIGISYFLVVENNIFNFVLTTATPQGRSRFITTQHSNSMFAEIKT